MSLTLPVWHIISISNSFIAMKKDNSQAVQPAEKTPKLKPLGDRVLLKEVSEKEVGRKTDSGIFIPDTVKEDRGVKQGKVLAVGHGRYEDGRGVPMEVKVGDVVLFQWGDMIEIDGVEYFLVKESESAGIIK